MVEVHHLGVRVADLDAVTALLGAAFDVSVEPDATSPPQRRIAYAHFANIRLELVEDLQAPPAGGPAALLDHLGVEVDDIEASMLDLSERGFASRDPAPRRGAFGHRVAAFDEDLFAGLTVHLISEKEERR